MKRKAASHFRSPRTVSLLLSAIVIVSLVSVKTHSQESRQLAQEKPKVLGNRLALVIGNGSYQRVSPLDNPVNDATDIAAALQTLGFEVIKGTDINLTRMRQLIREFGQKLEQQKGIGLFYYAGHGVEVRGRNFLVPVDADIAREVETEDYAIDVNSILRQMDNANNGFNIVILDACRNNPFSRGWNRSGDEGGLANVNAPTGTYIAFAAAPGSTASDGKGTRNGIFTGALLKNLKRPNLKLEEVFKFTRELVMTLTGRKQVPWDSSSVQGDFYFNLIAAKATANPPKNEMPIDETLTAKDAAAIEREAWSYIKNSTDPQDFRDFLKDFPAGANSGNAKIKLEQTVWDAVKDSRDKAKIQGYLTEFPSGVSVPLARIRLRQLDAPVVVPPSNTGGNASVNERAAPGTIRKNSVGMELVYIPPGEFKMGSSEDDIAESFYKAQQEYKDAKREWFDAEKPQRRVSISEEFWMGKFEVTQAQWRAVMGDNPSNFKDCDSCPVEKVSWDDTKIFLRKLNQSNDGFVYSLPTEAQWEYAARAGTTGLWAGNLEDMGWYGNNSGSKTHPVGQKRPNAFGLYDMHGNVWEWCEDYYGSYSAGAVTNPTGASSGEYRVLRGGSWGSFANLTRSADRVRYSPSYRNNYFGFRVAARGK